MIHNILLSIDFAKRDLKQRYIGTGLGQLWFIISPVVMIFIYSVIFSDFMKMKMNIVDNSYAYSIYLIPGLLAWTSFSNIILRLNTSFFEKANLIKKINVPMFVFQLSIAISELFSLFIAMLLGIGFLLVVNQPVTLEFLIIIPVLLLQTIFAFGIGVILSLFTPFFKDLKEVVPIVVQLWFWMTPIIYLSSMLEKKYPFLLKYNPFYYFVKIYQNVFLHSKLPTFVDLLTIVTISFVVLLLSAFLYKKMISPIKDII